jgi:uncharacterized protein YegP (UPF0339 family)
LAAADEPHASAINRQTVGTHMPGKFEIKRAKDNEFYFNLLAPNGEIILTSEMYRSKTGAKKGVAAVQANAGDPNRFDRRIDKRKEHYFVLKAANHRIVGCSEMYSDTTAMEKGIRSVMKNSKMTKITDAIG